MNQDEKIIQSWNDNAALWTNAVRTNALESRKLVTNEAIVKAVVSCGGNQVLDVGCGEGWLSLALIEKGKKVTGFDVSAALIEQAVRTLQTHPSYSKSTQTFQILTYENFANNPHSVGNDFDVIVCNFSLLTAQLNDILRAMRDIAAPNGHLIIQTLHPYSSLGEFPYEDGWRMENFHGLPGDWSPMPWYFRTMNSWMHEVTAAGWNLNKIIEPLHPVTGKPASLILDCV